MIKFGASGNSQSFFDMGFKSTYDTPKYLADKGLDAFEYSFGRGTNLTVDKAMLYGEEFKKYNIAISVHAPYYINFANTDEEKIQKSFMYILSSLKRLKALGGKRCVFHPATVGKSIREEAFEITLKNINRLVEKVYEDGYDDMILCPETMGKLNQIGTVEEIMQICKLDKIFIPTLDFGHINSRTRGGLKTKEDYKKVIDTIFKSLDEPRAKNVHIHFTKIQYGEKGEIRHLNMADNVYGPEFEPLAELLHEYKMTPVILTESNGTQAEDAQLLKKIYNNMVKYNLC